MLTRVHRDVRSCDAFANLIGSRYGSQVLALPLSYTHFEFALARRLDKPIISLLLAESEFEQSDKEWRSQYPTQDPVLVDLRREVRDAELEGVCVWFEYSRHTGATNSLEHAAKVAFADGKELLTAGRARNSVDRKQHVTNRQVPASSPDANVNEVFNAFAQYVGTQRGDKIATRLSAASAAKAEYAQYFWDYNLPIIAFGRALNLFFAAGSSSFFLVGVLVQALRWTLRVPEILTPTFPEILAP